MGYKIDYSSIVGPLHHKNNTENQDRYGFLENEEFFVVAVADGAGSLELSGQGAEESIKKFFDNIFKNIDVCENVDEALRKTFDETRDYIKSFDEWEKMGCTFAVCVFKKDGSFYSAGVVGDSFVVVKDMNDDYSLVRPEKSAEFVNYTTFLTSKKYDPFIVSGDSVKTVAVSSDGLEHVSIFKDEPSVKFWEPIFKRVSNGESFVGDFFKHMYKIGKITDDTTLVVVDV